MYVYILNKSTFFPSYHLKDTHVLFFVDAPQLLEFFNWCLPLSDDEEDYLVHHHGPCPHSAIPFLYGDAHWPTETKNIYPICPEDTAFFQVNFLNRGGLCALNEIQQ